MTDIKIGHIGIIYIYIYLHISTTNYSGFNEIASMINRTPITKLWTSS